eukprot:TRINITY_DN1063_c0_g1_i2.p1 TRINITY_DN1063_c0_g1~~TRINITY_DN1063_c0_g1_i2.p1  ORF type:complete len:272 (+),score=22.38 TRINITY_DN1063_c0_g1_i2:210-1025(+)
MLPWRRRSCNGLLRRPARRSAPLFLALLVCSITWSAVEMAELELAQDGPQTKSAAGDDPLEGDLDGDGVRDTVDQCPKTPAGKEVDWTGCNYDDHMAIHSSSSSTSGGPPGHLLDGKTDTFWDSHANRGSTAVGSTVTFRGGYGDGVAYQYYCRSDPSRDSRVFCDSAELGEYEQFKIERGPWSDPDRTDNKGWPHVAMKNLGTESVTLITLTLTRWSPCPQPERDPTDTAMTLADSIWLTMTVTLLIVTLAWPCHTGCLPNPTTLAGSIM